jgi:hypothetical protein
MFPTPHSHDINGICCHRTSPRRIKNILAPFFVTQKDDLKTDSTNIWLHFTVRVFKRLALFLPKAF